MASVARYAPMLAHDTGSLPADPGWGFEVKWDGVRALASVGGGGVALFARRGNEITHRYPDLVAPVAAPIHPDSVLDGEIVAFDADGKPSFQLLQQRMGLSDPGRIRQRAREVPVRFVAFDLLELDGAPRLDETYSERRARLAELGWNGERWQAPPHYVDEGEALLEAVRRQGLEGVVAKRLDSPYRPGERSRDWMKLRLRRQEDFLIGGWLPGKGGRSGRLGSVMLGAWNEDGGLHYAGAAGSGLTEAMIDDLHRRLGPLRRDTSPFATGVGPKRADAVWCEPELACAVEFSEWTHEGTLRQPAFKGLRDDVDPRSVVRES